MLANHFTALMLMQLLCFLGMIVMFLFVIRSLSQQNSMLREATRQQQNALVDMEQQLMDMSFLIRKNLVQGMSDDKHPDIPGHIDMHSLLEHAPSLAEKDGGFSFQSDDPLTLSDDELDNLPVQMEKS